MVLLVVDLASTTLASGGGGGAVASGAFFWNKFYFGVLIMNVLMEYFIKIYF